MNRAAQSTGIRDIHPKRNCSPRPRGQPHRICGGGIPFPLWCFADFADRRQDFSGPAEKHDLDSDPAESSASAHDRYDPADPGRVGVNRGS